MSGLNPIRIFWLIVSSIFLIFFAHSQILRTLTESSEFPIISMFNGVNTTYIISIDQSSVNRSFYVLQYQTRSITVKNIQIVGQITFTSIKQAYNSFQRIIYANKTIIQASLSRYECDQLSLFTQVLDSSYIIKGLFWTTPHYFILAYNSKISFKKNLSQIPSKIFESNIHTAIFIGTQNGSILQFKYKIFYDIPNRIGLWNFQTKINNLPINAVKNPLIHIISAEGVIQYDTLSTLGLGTSGIFDGSSYFKVSNIANYQSFTICAWFNTHNAFELGQSIFFATQFLLQIEDQKLFFEIGSSQRLTASKTLYSQVWYHAAASFNNSTKIMKLYLDGQLVAQKYNPSITSNNSGLLCIGGKQIGINSYFHGSIDEAMFFGVALKDSQVKQIYNQRWWEKANINAQGKITCFQDSLDGKQLYFGDNLGNIYIATILEDFSKIKVTQKFKNSDSKINSISEYQEGSQKYLLTSDNSGKIFLNRRNQSHTLTDSKQISDSRQKDLFISKIVNQNTFLSVSTGVNKITKWRIMSKIEQATLRCNQTYPKCEEDISSFEFQCTNIDINSTQILFSSANGQFCLKKCGVNYNLIKGQCIKRSSTMAAFSSSISSILQTPSIRRLCKLLSPIFGFLEEIWFYSYHNISYSVFIQTVFQETNRINEERIVPEIFDMTDLQANLSLLAKESLDLYVKPSPTFLKRKQKLNSLSYFANSKQILVIGTIYSLGGIVITLLVALFIRKYLKQKQIPYMICQWLLEKTSIAYIFIAVIEANLAVLAYFNFMQMKMPSFFDFKSKILMALAYASLYILVLYSFCFYLLIYGLLKRKAVENVLNCTKYQFSSFILATLTSGSKNLLNSYVHSAYEVDYAIQILLLALINLIQVVAILKNRSCYQKICFFIFILIYQLSLTLLDLSFLISYCFQSMAYYTEYVQITLIITILASIALLTISQFIVGIISIVKILIERYKFQLLKSNRIQDQLENSKQTKQQIKQQREQQIANKATIKTKREMITMEVLTTGNKKIINKTQRQNSIIPKLRKNNHSSNFTADNLKQLFTFNQTKHSKNSNQRELWRLERIS